MANYVGYHAGYSDANDIEFCPYCGAEISTMCADGSVECGECKRSFAVLEAGG